MFEKVVDEQGTKFDLKTTLDDHSSSITSIKFSELSGTTRLVSCSADKSIAFRSLEFDLEKKLVVSPYHREIIQGPPADMELDPEGKELLLLVGSDKKVNAWSVASGKKTRTVNNIETDKEKGTTHTT